ncbi:long-chain fatty acid--CoA ligase [candidate division KSB3 bacterium]|uniref:Long-chain fatty acid--CoA ligase n=1 Tax=candidate division KSB3 bacterium TaxID=2044937 RepID=A0A2G6E231_9BACT|nr:MAG: long-chain fatty acid--CoA ligase [candidate division KSB3 bacterium]PIE28786.1 MAG: long-chain fatty acid--CoA ligase [candidate division KSB3 bacterium]
MIPEQLVHVIEAAVKQHWDSPAFSDYEGTTLSYGDLAGEISRMHKMFRKAHLKQGDTIAAVGKNSTNWALTYLATLSYGAVIVPILADFTADNIHHIVNHSDSKLLFCADLLYEKLDESQMPQLEAIFSLNDFRLLHFRKKHFPEIVSQAGGVGNRPALDAKNLSYPNLTNDRLATIMYTSGTTGFSKGVMLSHNSLMANILFAQKHMPLKQGDRIMSFLPLAHAYGCLFEFLFPFTLGCHITFLTKLPSPKLLLEAFQTIRPSLILSVPLIIEKIYQKQIQPLLSKKSVQWLLRVPPAKKLLYAKIRKKLMAAFGENFFEIVIGGAALDPEVEAFFKEIRFPVTVGYGMTECGPLISYADWKSHRAGSSGRCIDFLELEVDASQSSQEVGQIRVRGENVMLGYYKNEDATRDVLDEEGWLKTGDLGLVDQDGFLFLKGRCKNVLLGPSGHNIYPEELEARLNHLPFTQESLVLEKNGKLIAMVYPDFERADSEGLDETQLAEKMEKNRKALNKTLPAYSALSKIELYPKEFEKTPTRKIKRFLYQI